MAAAGAGYHQLTIRLPTFIQGQVIRKLAELGSLGIVENKGRIVAYFPDDHDLSSVIFELGIIRSLLQTARPGSYLLVDHNNLAATDWNAAWKTCFTPIPVGERFTVLPPWEHPLEGRIPLYIDPGMAFGTGHHETTRSCIILMERHAFQGGRSSFLDIGTGTGLLAIAAVKLGFHQCRAVDTDPQAIEAARSNIRLNDAKQIELIQGELGSARGTYDMIAANLISGTLVALARPIAERLAPVGAAILSGILHGQEGEVLEAMRQAGLLKRELLIDGKWVTVAVGR